MDALSSLLHLHVEMKAFYPRKALEGRRKPATPSLYQWGKMTPMKPAEEVRDGDKSLSVKISVAMEHYAKVF